MRTDFASAGGTAPEETGATWSDPFARRRERELWRRFLECGDRDARAGLFEVHRPVAERMARRYAGVAEPYDDLFQVASLGLMNAIDRFDPERGDAFMAYAKPTIHGELKRHFRDRVWTVRVPRSLHDLIQRVEKASEATAAREGRPATVDELAAELGVEQTEILEALEAQIGRRLVSLDAPPPTEDGDDSVPEWIGTEEEGYARAEDRALLQAAVGDLTAEETELLRLRFVEELPQSRIAEELGWSQMHISRWLRVLLEGLRTKAEGSAA